MANEKNLLKLGELPPEERRERASKAGKASGEARRKRKAMKSVLNELLTLPAESDEAKTALAGVEHLLPECDNQAAVLAGLMKQAMLGEVKAVQEIRNILGESRDTAAEKAERKARTEKLKAETAAVKAKTGEQGALGREKENNLLAQLRTLPEEELDGIPELQPEAETGDDVVEPAETDAP